jgi:protease I
VLRILFVIAPERYRDEELAVPRAALIAAGHDVTVASTRAGEARGMLGAREIVTHTVAGETAASFDAIAILGGSGAPEHLWSSEPLRALVRAMHAAGKPVAAICLAPPVLARAGILMDRRATTFPSARAILELKRGGATFVEEPVVQDGSIITGIGPEAAAEFGATLTHFLGT